MSEDSRLYESAALAKAELKPLWHVARGRMLFAGRLGRNVLHSHSAPVLLAGLYENIRFRVDGGRWKQCRAAVVRAGTAYEFDARGQPMAVVYVEPSQASADGLAALVSQTHEEPGAIIGMHCDLGSFRSLYEDAQSLGWADESMADLIAYSTRKARRSIDARIRRAVEQAEGEAIDSASSFEGRNSVAFAARAANLSTSRFQHLFKQEAGVSYRRYAAWTRMRVAVSEVVNGANFTTAAHAAGFYDQPHFSREFRRIFGAPASRSLAGARCKPSHRPFGVR